MTNLYWIFRNLWVFVWRYLILVVLIRLTIPNKPSWISDEVYPIVAGYEWRIPLLVFLLIAIVMVSAGRVFNMFPVISLIRGKGLTNGINEE